MLELNKLDNLV